MVDLINDFLFSYICSPCYIGEHVCKRRINKDADESLCKECKETKIALENAIKLWLDSFNTDSATVCFTAIQELKKAVSEDG